MFSNSKSDRAHNPAKTKRERFFASKPSSEVAQKQESPVQRQSTSRTRRTFSATEVLMSDGSTEVIQPQTKVKTPIQTKLAIGEVGDKYEREADRVAKETVQHLRQQPLQRDKDAPPVQQRPLSPYKLQRRQELQGGEVSTELETQIDRAKSGGQSLAPDLQGKMGQAMGTDFSHVKVHTDTHSDRLNQSLQAKAFTTGNHVFFKKGEYSPNSTKGQELLAHELTHVVQQNGGVQRKTDNTQMIQCGFFSSLFGSNKKEKEEKPRSTKDNIPNEVRVALSKSATLKTKEFRSINLKDIFDASGSDVKVSIIDENLLTVISWFADTEMSTENINALILLSNTNSGTLFEMLAVAERLLETIEPKNYTYQNFLPRSSYRYGDAPENVNIPDRERVNLENCYKTIKSALRQNPSVLAMETRNMLDFIKQAKIAISRNISTDTMNRLTLFKPLKEMANN